MHGVAGQPGPHDNADVQVGLQRVREPDLKLGLGAEDRRGPGEVPGVPRLEPMQDAHIGRGRRRGAQRPRRKPGGIGASGLEPALGNPERLGIVRSRATACEFVLGSDDADNRPGAQADAIHTAGPLGKCARRGKLGDRTREINVDADLKALRGDKDIDRGIADE